MKDHKIIFTESLNAGQGQYIKGSSIKVTMKYKDNAVQLCSSPIN